MSIETGIGAYLATPDLSAWVYLKSFRSLSEAKENCPKLAEEIEVSCGELGWFSQGAILRLDTIVV